MGKYNNPDTLEEAKNIIKSQDEMIGSMLRELNGRKDQKINLDQSRDKMKKEAGFNTFTSFDVVWKKVLSKSKRYDNLDKKIGVFYTGDDQECSGDLGDIGEIAASHFGYLG